MNTNTTRVSICGNPGCKTSTGIYGYMTHGWGKLSDNGFWEHECPEHEKHRKQDDELCRSLGLKNGELA